ncbi:MAG: ABC transporter permease, partial [Spirochaetaceae bacterium]|nr:ABC transporter permease [Spirochaetaceae bacterium]
LIFAARIKSEELASGLMNLLTFPMIIFSGVFFSLEGTPQIMKTISKVFPLTHFIEGARSIMIDGAGFIEILPNILVLGGMTIVFLVISSALFRWE